MGIWQNRKPWQKGAIAGFGVAILIGAGAALPFFFLGAPVVLAALVAAPLIGPVVAAGIAALGIVGAVAVAGLALAAMGAVVGGFFGSIVGHYTAKAAEKQQIQERRMKELDIELGAIRAGVPVQLRLAEQRQLAAQQREARQREARQLVEYRQQLERNMNAMLNDIPKNDGEVNFFQFYTLNTASPYLMSDLSFESLIENNPVHREHFIKIINDLSASPITRGKLGGMSAMFFSAQNKSEKALYYYAYLFFQGRLDISSVPFYSQRLSEKAIEIARNAQALRQEALRQEALRQEALRQEALHQEAQRAIWFEKRIEPMLKTSARELQQTFMLYLAMVGGSSKLPGVLSFQDLIVEDPVYSVELVKLINELANSTEMRKNLEKMPAEFTGDEGRERAVYYYAFLFLKGYLDIDEVGSISGGAKLSNAAIQLATEAKQGIEQRQQQFYN